MTVKFGVFLSDFTSRRFRSVSHDSRRDTLNCDPPHTEDFRPGQVRAGREACLERGVCVKEGGGSGSHDDSTVRKDCFCLMDFSEEPSSQAHLVSDLQIENV